MELEEAVKTTRNFIDYFNKNKCDGNKANLEVLGEEKEAVETVLEELRKYREGEIISLKVLEHYYLVSKDKEKQITLANKELFKEYVPKKIADKQEKMIDLIITELAHYDNEIICASIKCEDIGCKKCLKQYFEKKAEEAE